MGMERAFSPDYAELSELALSQSGNVYVSSVIHKAHISVDESGTKAAAATAIITYDNEAKFYEEELMFITLDRPFLFAIYDYQKDIPIFIGTVMSLPDDAENTEAEYESINGVIECR